jgi:hypothetical protein
MGLKDTPNSVESECIYYLTHMSKELPQGKLLSIMRREQVVHSLNKPIAFISHEYYTP